MMISKSILWRRLDRAGHEYACVYTGDSGWRLSGTAVFEHDRQPCRLDYVVVCDSEWRTQSGNVAGWIGVDPVGILLSVDSAGSWQVNGADYAEVAGCVDIDLNFSPSTNLLPIRRFCLAVGQQAAVRAAWLRFPDFTLAPLEQIYRRIDETTYRYESAGGRFVTELKVNEAGFVTLYPTFCEAEATI